MTVQDDDGFTIIFDVPDPICYSIYRGVKETILTAFLFALANKTLDQFEMIKRSMEMRLKG